MKNAILLIVIIALIVVGFFGFKAMQKGDEIVTEEGRTVQISLAEQNASGVSGTATLSDKEGVLVVSLSMSGTPAGSLQPAHIHLGSCSALGNPRFTLNDVSGGTSETELVGVTVAQILSELPLSVNVHKSAQESSVYVACGDIVSPDAPAPAPVVESATTTASTTTPDTVEEEVSATSTATSSSIQ